MSVARIGLAALKGSQHRPRQAVMLTGQGPAGDRSLCLIDPRLLQVVKTVANPSLLAAAVSYEQGVLAVELAGRIRAGAVETTGEKMVVSYWGRPVTVDVVGGPWASMFSQLLGRPVLLASALPGDIVYGQQVTVVTTASVAALLPVSRTPPYAVERLAAVRDSPRFRATFTIEVAGTRYAEAGSESRWVGRELTLGDARVRLTAPVARCGVVDLHPVTGQRDLRVLASLPRDVDGEAEFGLQGRVTQPGMVSQGARVSIDGEPATGW